MTTQTLTIKKGETFLLDGQLFEDDGITVKPLTGITLSSQLRNSKENLINTFVITVLNEQSGTFRVASETSTVTWPEGELFFDIMQTENGVTTISDTKIVKVMRAMTR